MEEIFVVTSGEYSDYCIEAVFSTREKAELYIENYGDNSPWVCMEIKVYNLDEGVSHISKGKLAYKVWMELNGDLYDDLSVISPEGFGGEFIEVQKSAYRERKGLSPLISAVVLAKSEEHAIRRVNDWRREYLNANKHLEK